MARYRAGRGPAHVEASGRNRHQRSSTTLAHPLSNAERERRLAKVADSLVRTMRSVPMPGVQPFSKRDRLAIFGVVAIEAVLVGLIVGAPRG